MTLANSRPKYYWDACIWISLIVNRHSDRGRAIEYFLEQAKNGACEIWASSFCLAAVYKRKCDDENVGIDEEHDTYFEDLIEQEFIHKVSVDLDVGKVARRLLRRFPKIGKAQDAIHVATALLHNIDELHTYDREDLLGLNGQLGRLDQKMLKFCKPPDPPTDAEPNLFEDDEKD